MKSVRHVWVVVLGATTAGFLVLMGAVAAGHRVPAARVLAQVPQKQTLDYSIGPPRRVPPLRPDIARDPQGPQPRSGAPPTDTRGPEAAPPAGGADCVLRVPREASPTRVLGRPKEGSYLWRVRAEVTVGGRTSTSETTERRVVKDVRDDGAGPGAFTYSMVQKEGPLGPSDQTVTTFRVVPSGPTEDRVTVPTDLAEGIFVVQIVRSFSSQGGPREWVFQPSPPITYAQFPFEQGRQTDSTGADPSGAHSMQHRATVQGRHTFQPACDVIFDGWLISGIQTYRQGEEVDEYRYAYAIAGQWGGMIVFERIESPRINPTRKIEATLKQIVPG